MTLGRFTQCRLVLSFLDPLGFFRLGIVFGFVGFIRSRAHVSVCDMSISKLVIKINF